jgi:nucleotide-binding universal stress UspA family protein
MRVLVGVDGSPFSTAVLRYIVGMRWPKETRFLVLSAATPFFGRGEASPSGAIPSDAISELMRRQVEHHRSIAERAAARLRRAGLAAEARAVIADPRTALTDATKAGRVKLVIVGSHGKTGVKRILLGSVASHVVTHARSSVLVVRGGPRHG